MEITSGTTIPTKGIVSSLIPKTAPAKENSTVSSTDHDDKALDAGLDRSGSVQEPESAADHENEYDYSRLLYKTMVNCREHLPSLGNRFNNFVSQRSVLSLDILPPGNKPSQHRRKDDDQGDDDIRVGQPEFIHIQDKTDPEG